MGFLDELFQFQRYYGTDYMAAACVVVAMAMLGDRKRAGFLFYMLATCFAMAFAIMVRSFPIMLTNGIMFALNLRGFLKWRHATLAERNLSMRMRHLVAEFTEQPPLSRRVVEAG
jgi:4-amino-4-deoxy-L-arabinose transferase-like glycosyltransferase